MFSSRLEFRGFWSVVLYASLFFRVYKMFGHDCAHAWCGEVDIRMKAFDKECCSKKFDFYITNNWWRTLVL